MKIEIKHILIIAIILFGIYLLINRCGCNDTFIIGANQNNASLCNWYNTFPREGGRAQGLCEDSEYCKWDRRNRDSMTRSCLPLEVNERGEPIKDYMRVWCRRHMGPNRVNLCRADEYCDWVHQFGGMSDNRCAPISLSTIPEQILNREHTELMYALIREGGVMKDWFEGNMEDFNPVQDPS